MKHIPLTMGKVAMVDDADFTMLSEHRWYARQTTPGRFYAVRYERRAGVRFAVYMHRSVCDGLTEERNHVDHIDGDGLNNQRSNLRACNPHENHGNQKKARIDKTSSRYKGVSWDGARKRWKAVIKVNGKHIDIGRFKDECDAATAYNFAAEAAFGEFAVGNHAARMV